MNASANICTLKEWLCDERLRIPDYQRPYKWALPQVQQLLSDIEQQASLTAQNNEARTYRMGTVIVHVDKETGDHHIVDGQQRTVTLLLVLHGLKAVAQALPEDKRQTWHKDLLSPSLALFNPEFPSPDSHRQVQANYTVIHRHVRQAQWDERHVKFFLERCEVVRVQLHNLTEAFQFFDAQNARGKALCVHDLLKAFHLRALRPQEQKLRSKAVQVWEQCSEGDMERLFARFLFQTRQRSRGRDAEYFGKRHVGIFKGINLEDSAAVPMNRAWHMLDIAVREGKQAWPCQLDAPVVNGLRFFDWVQHYWGMDFHLKQEKNELPPWTQKLKQPLAEDACDILKMLGNYEGCSRKGDSHVRAVFDALLIYYLDKFGEQGLSQAVTLAFTWAYARLLHRRVMVGSMDKFLSEGSINPFAALRDATTPQEFLSIDLPTASYGNSYQNIESSRPKGLEKIQKWIQKLGYWKQENKKTNTQATTT